MTRLTPDDAREAEIRRFLVNYDPQSDLPFLVGRLDAVRAERDEKEFLRKHWEQKTAQLTLDLAAAQARLAEIQTFVLEQKRRTESTDNGDDNPLNQRDLYDSLLERLGTAQVEAPHAVESQAGRPMLQPMVPDWMRAERAEATLAAIRAWADNRRACISWTAQKEVRAILDAAPKQTGARLTALTVAIRAIYEAALTLIGYPEDCEDCADLARRPCALHDPQSSKALYEALLCVEDHLGPCQCGHARSAHNVDDARPCHSCACEKFRLSPLALLDAKPVVTEDPRLAAIRAACQQWHRNTLFAKQIRALLDAPPSPEKG